MGPADLLLPLGKLRQRRMDKDSQDVHQVLNELKTKFQEMRKMISTMPGIGVSPEQQQQQLHNLREQVRTKNELLQKYKSLCRQKALRSPRPSRCRSE
ncbi:mediator of RNA polymerase II transcription subunit 9 [Alligator mississippiensis]|uniref:Mediator of RNA polymerase II transcription subunit 9 n=1 Tax=Alligator mississippiensis TaxID=8496 RepID=A0A151N1T3_ALLMI|nr:mediator of RNA polymerase II transcription subunit 9 [Alligator mississippiensis]